MTEFEKLKHRLKNVGRNTTEYRMSVAEARNLVLEFEALKTQLEKPQVEEVLNEPTVITRIIDGGAF
jgi:regulator of replication initiation timing